MSDSEMYELPTFQPQEFDLSSLMNSMMSPPQTPSVQKTEFGYRTSAMGDGTVQYRRIGWKES
jgi:hypothetical protein